MQPAPGLERNQECSTRFNFPGDENVLNEPGQRHALIATVRAKSATQAPKQRMQILPK
jgi:hypothetical protein